MIMSKFRYFFAYLSFFVITMLKAQAITTPPRIITTDWAIAETLLMIDAPLVGIGDLKQYDNWVVYPKASDNVIDLGLRTQPNMEALFKVNATLLINSSWFQQILPPELVEDRYQLYAVDFYTEKGLTWENSVQQTQLLGQITQREVQAEQLIQQVDANFEANKQLLSGFSKRPIAIVQFIDFRHLRIYGQNSLYGLVLNRLNLSNAWQKETNHWGFDQITLLDLARLPANTLLIMVAPYPIHLTTNLAKNKIWAQLPFAKSENHRFMPAVWAFGALPSMQRLSDFLVKTLLHSVPDFKFQHE